MSHFIIEHKRGGGYTMETVTGVEDVDINQYQPLIGVWVCETDEEVKAMQTELRRMRHE
jgi:hypothetical protein